MIGKKHLASYGEAEIVHPAGLIHGFEHRIERPHAALERLDEDDRGVEFAMGKREEIAAAVADAAIDRRREVRRRTDYAAA